MFDIGFTELLLIGVVALVVVGPERLPSLIRTTLGYVRQFKSSFSHIKSEVERELDLADLKKDLLDSEESISKAVGYDDLHESLNDLRKETKNLTNFSTDDLDEISANKFVDNGKITDDLDELQLQHGPNFPDPDSEAETGVEQNLVEQPSKVSIDNTKS